METRLNKAIDLRKNEKYKESNEILINLVKEFPSHASILYQCAVSFDLLGEESKAAPLYEKAIQMGLPKKELENALIGLGSTYRTLGEYEKSHRTFLKGMEQFPENRAMQTFYAMTLYNLNEHKKAMELLLSCLIDTTKDEEILKYKNAIHFYLDKLDQTWK